MTAVPGKYNITVKQGSSFSQKFVYENSAGVPYNLTGYGAKMQVREYFNGPVLLELTTDNGKLVITPLTGEIEMILKPLDTKSLNFSKAIYDLDIYIGNNVYTLFEGVFTLNSEVTKDVISV